MATFPMTPVGRKTPQQTPPVPMPQYGGGISVGGESAQMPARSQLGVLNQYQAAMSGGLRNQRPTSSDWAVGGRTYPTGDPGAMAGQNQASPSMPGVAPRFGQTAQMAQQSYAPVRNTASEQTIARSREMFPSQQVFPVGMIGGARRIGSFVGPSGNENVVTRGDQRTGQGPVTVTGQRSAAEYGGMTSNLPGANNRTNAEMFAARRAAMAQQQQQRQAGSVLANASQYGLSPKSSLAVRNAYTTAGIPIPGMPRGAQAATGAAAVATEGGPQAAAKLAEAAKSPHWQFLGKIDPATANPYRMLNEIGRAAEAGQLDPKTWQAVQADVARRMKADPSFLQPGMFTDPSGLAPHFGALLNSSPQDFVREYQKFKGGNNMAPAGRQPSGGVPNRLPSAYVSPPMYNPG